jgi:hypothetical protein
MVYHILCSIYIIYGKLCITNNKLYYNILYKCWITNIKII